MHADVRTGPLEGERRGRRKAETVAIDSGPLRIVLHSNTSGQITDKIEMLGGLRTHWRYVYDVDGRLWGSLLNGQPAEAYQYDAATGARVLETSEPRGVAEREYVYGPSLRLLRAGDTFFEYDEDGRMTARIRRGPAGDVVERFHYDAQGRLSRVALPGGETLEYDHDGQGRLRCRTVDGMASKEYEWDGPLRLSSFFNGAYHRFEYGQGRMPEAMIVNGRDRYSLGFDQVGSLRAVADDRGHLVKIVAYDSWGNVLHDSNPNLEVPFGFAGGIRDEDTGLVRFLHRDYDPAVARWTAPDPIGPLGGDVDQYGYCLDDPVNFFDPSGLWLSGDTPGERIVFNGLEWGVSGAVGGGLAGGPLGALVGGLLAIPVGLLEAVVEEAQSNPINIKDN